MDGVLLQALVLVTGKVGKALVLCCLIEPPSPTGNAFGRGGTITAEFSPTLIVRLLSGELPLSVILHFLLWISLYLMSSGYWIVQLHFVQACCKYQPLQLLFFALITL